MNALARPHSIEEAVSLMAQTPHLLLAGGTDVFPGAGRDLKGPILDLTTIPNLRGIRNEGGLRIGACTTWTELADATLPSSCRALQQAARQIGGRQIQNVGTVGGNLCNASPAADGVPPLLALDATVELHGPKGSRLLPLADFLLGPRKTSRNPDEILTAIWLPEAALIGRSTFLKLGARAYLVISIAMVAARVHVEEGTIQSAALAVGSCTASAIRLPGLEEALIGKTPQSALDLIRSVQIGDALSPISDVRATAEYRQWAAADLVRRAVSEVLA